MSTGLEQQRRLLKRGQRLVREASALFAQVADAAGDGRSPARVVDQMTCTDIADARIAAVRIERAFNEHGQVDVLVIPTHQGPTEGAQEDHHGPELQRQQEAGGATELADHDR